MKYVLISLLALAACTAANAQAGKPAYVLYDGNGRQVQYEKMVADLASADVVMIGEHHNNPISHWLEYEITASIHEIRQGMVVLGAEMFEADTQLMLDEYVSGMISTTRFEADSRLWHNYSTDYEPLVAFARENGLRFVATNIPRRYADMVNKGGGLHVLDALSDEAKGYMAPRPMPLKPDSVMLAEGSIMSMMSKDPLAIAKAQAVKDATMAYFITRNMEDGKVFIHYNGSYHSDFHDGILHFLNIYKPGLTIKTVSTVLQDEPVPFDTEAYGGVADYVICVPVTMTKTY